MKTGSTFVIDIQSPELQNIAKRLTSKLSSKSKIEITFTLEIPTEDESQIKAAFKKCFPTAAFKVKISTLAFITLNEGIAFVNKFKSLSVHNDLEHKDVKYDQR